jgi:excisionase family DNA binding protein
VTSKPDHSPSQGDPFLDTTAAAAYLGVSRPTLERWRASNRGPAATFISARIVRYRRSALDGYLDAVTSRPDHAA